MQLRQPASPCRRVCSAHRQARSTEWVVQILPQTISYLIRPCPRARYAQWADSGLGDLHRQYPALFAFLAHSQPWKAPPLALVSPAQRVPMIRPAGRIPLMCLVDHATVACFRTRAPRHALERRVPPTSLAWPGRIRRLRLCAALAMPGEQARVLTQQELIATAALIARQVSLALLVRELAPSVALECGAAALPRQHARARTAPLATLVQAALQQRLQQPARDARQEPICLTATTTTDGFPAAREHPALSAGTVPLRKRPLRPLSAPCAHHHPLLASRWVSTFAHALPATLVRRAALMPQGPRAQFALPEHTRQ
jgi:hypothetical protein